MSGETPIARLVFNQDIGLFDRIAEEEVRLFGASANYYSLDSRNRDPLYQETVMELFRPPELMYANIEWARQDEDGEATEFGGRMMTEAEIKIPRVFFERVSLVPKMGDVVTLFVESKKPVTFDVTKANEGEPVYNSDSFVWYSLHGKKRSEADPEIRLEGRA